MSTTEWIAVLATILSVIMITLGKTSGWIFGIIGNLLYGLIFVEQKLYANFIIQIVFILQGFYGVFEWKRKTIDTKPFLSKKIDSTSLFIITFLTLGLSISISLVMFIFTDNKNPILDTTLSICSIVAVTLMIKKIIQSWFMWMFIDIGYIYLFISIGLWVSAVLYCLLFILCINGYIQWNKKIKFLKL